MKNAKNQFDVIAKNQEAMVSSLTGNMEKVTAVLAIDETITTEGKALVQNYMEQQKNIFQAMIQPVKPEQFFTQFNAISMKAMDMMTQFSTDYMNFAQKAVATFSPEKQVKKVETLIKLSKENAELLTSTAKKNSDLVVEYFK